VSSTLADNISGNLELASDKDWFKISLDAGVTYQFILSGPITFVSGFEALGLYNSSGKILAYEYDRSVIDGPLISFAPSETGNYYLEAGDVLGQNTGTYNISASTIVASDSAPPTVTTFTPTDEATGVAVGINVLVTFSEAIARGTGNIVLKTSSGTTIATYDAATSSNLAISGSTLYLNPSADLTFSTGYTVEFAAGSVKDLAGNSFAGSASYNFTTQSVPAPLSFTSSSANEAFIGGAGTDTVIFNGSLANYSIAKQGSTYTVTNKAGADGTDTVTNIESLKFADMTVNLQVQSIAAATPLADVHRISELYVAFFNRHPRCRWTGLLDDAEEQRAEHQPGFQSRSTASVPPPTSPA
jgi:hypothetical protein